MQIKNKCLCKLNTAKDNKENHGNRLVGNSENMPWVSQLKY